MKVALVQMPVWWPVDPPLGLAQMAGCLKAAGHEVHLYDLNILLWKERLPQYANMWLWEQFHFWNHPEVVDRFFEDNRRSIDGYVDQILRSDSAVVGFSIYAGTNAASLKLASLIKQADPKRTVVFGGQYFFLGDKAAQALSHPAVDAVVRGPADEAFPLFVADYERTGRFVPRPGVVFRGGDGLVDGGPAPQIANLDRLPFPDFSGFPMDLYEDQTRIPIAASRGCVWACRFCSTREFWHGYSHMSGDRIFAEIKHQKSLFPQRAHFEFYDITANGRPEALHRFSLLAKEFLAPHLPGRFFRWKINAILRPEMTSDLLKTMQEGGCQDIIYGVESGSPRVLKRMNKNYNVDVAERVLRDTRLAGIHTTGNFMFGFPGETEEDFEMTLAFLRRNRQWLERAYGSATFTSLEEYSHLTDHQEEFGIRRETEKAAHNLYWESRDGANTYPVRLERYRRFRQTCMELGIDAYKGVNGSLEQDHLANLAQYYQYKDERISAVRTYVDYLEIDLPSEPIRNRLKMYQKDLLFLVRASKLVEKANALMAELNGHSGQVARLWRSRENKDGLLDIPVMKHPMSRDESAVFWISRYLGRAQRLLGFLKHRGSLDQKGGLFRIFWEKDPLPDLKELRRLQEKVDVIVRLSEAESKRSPSGKEAPCVR